MCKAISKMVTKNCFHSVKLFFYEIPFCIFIRSKPLDAEYYESASTQHAWPTRRSRTAVTSSETCLCGAGSARWHDSFMLSVWCGTAHLVVADSSSDPAAHPRAHIITYLCATFFTYVSPRVRSRLFGSSSRVWGLETTPRSVTCCWERSGHIVRNKLLSYQQYTCTEIIVTVLNYYAM